MSGSVAPPSHRAVRRGESASIALVAVVDLAGWIVAGATVGAVVGSAALARNPSLHGPGQAGPWILWAAGGYAVALMTVGLVATAVARPWRRERPPAAAFAASWIAAFLAFAAFCASQAAIATLTSRADTHPENVAASVAVALVVAVVARLAGSRAMRPDLARFAAPLALLVSTFAGLASTVAARAERVVAAAETPRVARDPDARSRVLLIGIDGLDWGTLRPSTDAHRLPAFRELLARSYRAELATREPSWSTIAWTTIATGVPEDVHGVLDVTEVAVPGLERGIQRSYAKGAVRPLLPASTGLAAAFELAVRRRQVAELPLSARHRRSKAYWNVLSEQGVSAAVVRAWASSPEERLAGGFVVGVGDPPATELSVSESRSGDSHATLDAIERGDRHAVDCALRLWSVEQVESCAVHLRAIGAASRRMGRFRGALERTWEATDRLLAELVAAAGPDATIVLVSLHGGGPELGEALARDPALPGVIAIAGPDVVPGDVPPDAPSPTVLDVCPTLLALHGLPRSAEMPGRPLREAFRPGTPAAAERPAIPSWGRYRPCWPAAGAREDAGRGGPVEPVHHAGSVDSSAESGL